MRHRLSNLLAMPAAAAFGVLLLVVVMAAVFEPITLTSYGITLDRVATIALVAVALTLVIVLGEIDLSVGATMAVSGAVMVTVSNNVVVGALAAVGVGLLIGLINACLVVWVKVNSFIATLGSMTFLSGLALIITDNNPLPMSDLAAPIAFTTPVLDQLTIPVLITVALSALAWVVLERTRAGRELVAVGGNPEAAAAANLPVARRRATGFVVCSVLAAIAGVLETVKQAAASPTMGQSVLLIAIAGAVLGGGLLSGGRGSVVGAVIGSVALGGISVGLELYGIDNSLENVIIGVILFLAVVGNRRGIAGLRLDLWRRRLLPTR